MDFDGDGRIDIWDSRADILATIGGNSWEGYIGIPVAVAVREPAFNPNDRREARMQRPVGPARARFRAAMAKLLDLVGQERWGLPIVLVKGSRPDLSVPCISTDDQGAVRTAVNHLTSLGHTRFGLAVGPSRFVPVERKVLGFRAAMESDPFIYFQF